ncbi:MerR family transcriptional regulator [Anaerosalibacter sp. Marseille-P3206]|uniref:MerR family transcriptional regulator n=1 Tax=Anaerosalibacter sp. Marseille-P3206 TaxID=1871005 RepID=UPI000985FE8B|nr:MerR family transcriptional regulator [Anaerosalibacter sp. Marseille-P3206]
MDIDEKYTISEMAEIIDYPPHVLRYYEKEFEIDIPRNESNHRYYTYKEIELFQYIKELQEKGFNNKQIKTIIESPEELVDEQDELALTRLTSLEKIDTRSLCSEISTNLYEKIYDDLKPLLELKYDNNQKLILELKDELEKLRKEISSKERDVLICENAKLKMKVKEKSYEVAELREQIKRKENSNKNIFKKIFRL